MQTFLPFLEFGYSARVLDHKRLNSQINEAHALYEVATVNRRSPWYNHPAAVQWRNYRPLLAHYHNVMLCEWLARGYRSPNRRSITPVGPLTLPPWLGAPAYHLSHQSNLLRKLPIHYARFFPGIPFDLPYLWPSKEDPWASSPVVAPAVFVNT